MFMASVILSLGLLINKYINTRVDITQAHANNLNYRILFESSLPSTDKYTGRMYPLHYKSNELNSLQEELQMRPERLGAGAKITIEKANDERYRKIFYYNKLAYDRLKLLKGTVFGQDSLTTKSAYPVVLEYKNILVPATLTIEVYVPK